MTDNPSHFKPGADATERSKRGHARMKEIAAETKFAIETCSGIMIEGLGRPATEVERLTAIGIASLHLRAARLRDQGKDDSEILMRAAIMTRDSVFRSPHAVTEQPSE
jgi:hypothetical protein